MLYLREVIPDAAPKCISGRTSYLRVRLAFYPYPQLIPSLCNVNGFGPSRNVTFASAWPWVAHTVSGLLRATERPVQTRFRFGYGAERLNLATQSNSLAHSSIGTLSSTRRWTPTDCRHTVSVLFHSPAWGAFHLSLTVLVRYRSLEVLSLGGWSPQVPTGFHVSRRTQVLDKGGSTISLTGLSPSSTRLSSTAQLSLRFVTPRKPQVASKSSPTTPVRRKLLSRLVSPGLG